MRGLAAPMVLLRAVTREECDWLDEDLPEGQRVFMYNGATYGCISPNGIAVSMQPNETPFFEVPADAVGLAKTNAAEER